MIIFLPFRCFMSAGPIERNLSFVLWAQPSIKHFKFATTGTTPTVPWRLITTLRTWSLNRVHLKTKMKVLVP